VSRLALAAEVKMMRRTLYSLSFALLLAASVALTAGAQRKSPAQGAKGKATPTPSRPSLTR
jgi:hypothetical protein